MTLLFFSLPFGYPSLLELITFVRSSPPIPQTPASEATLTRALEESASKSDSSRPRPLLFWVWLSLDIFSSLRSFFFLYFITVTRYGFSLSYFLGYASVRFPKSSSSFHPTCLTRRRTRSTLVLRFLPRFPDARDEHHQSRSREDFAVSRSDKGPARF